MAIIPFYNGTGDPSLNWMGASLAETLSSDIGQSAHLRSVSPARLQQVLSDLHISPESQLDISTLKRVADFTGADTVVFGQYQKFGEQVRINSTVLDLKQDRRMEIQTDAASEKELLASLDKLADEVRQKLAATPEILEGVAGPLAACLYEVGARTARVQRGTGTDPRGRQHQGGYQVRRGHHRRSKLCHGFFEVGTDLRQPRL